MITAAILAVPFGLWWVYDRTNRSSARSGPPRPRIDTEDVGGDLAAQPPLDRDD